MEVLNLYDRLKKFAERLIHSSLMQYVIAILLTPMCLATILISSFDISFSNATKRAISECERKISVASSDFSKRMMNAQSVLNNAARHVNTMIESGASDEEIIKWICNEDSEVRKKFMMNFIMIYGILSDKYYSSAPWCRAEGYDHTVRSWFTEAIKNNGRTTLLAPYMDLNTGHIVITLTTALSGNNVIAIDCFFSDIFTVPELGDSDEVFEWYLLDKNANLYNYARNKQKVWENATVPFDLRKYVHWSSSAFYIPRSIVFGGQKFTLLHSDLMDGWRIVSTVNRTALRERVINSLSASFTFSVLFTLVVWLSLAANFITLQRAKNRMESAEKSKALFFSSISHDIRTPLNSIIGFSQLLKDPNVSEQRRNEYVNDIIISGNALMQLINDVLDLSKLDANKMKYVYDFTDVNELIKSVAATFVPSARATGNNLVVHNEPNLPILKIDKHRTRQILTNLISNAIKFTNCGKISVATSFEKTSSTLGRLTYTVTDSGIGISKENIRKIHSPFVQIGDGVVGTGLGLTICTKLLSQMNGSMNIESEEGKGSVFTISMNDVEYTDDRCHIEKVSDAAAGNAAIQTNSQVPADMSQLKFLLVDDIELNLKVLSRMISAFSNITTKMARSGAEALTILSKESFDAVLTDIQMPEMDGEELMKKIRETDSSAGTKIYAVTADVNFMNKWSEKGFDGLLLKPVTIDGLKKFVVTHF